MIKNSILPVNVRINLNRSRTGQTDGALWINSGCMVLIGQFLEKRTAGLHLRRRESGA